MEPCRCRRPVTFQLESPVTDRYRPLFKLMNSMNWWFSRSLDYTRVLHFAEKRQNVLYFSIAIYFSVQQTSITFNLNTNRTHTNRCSKTLSVIIKLVLSHFIQHYRLLHHFPSIPIRTDFSSFYGTVFDKPFGIHVYTTKPLFHSTHLLRILSTVPFA